MLQHRLVRCVIYRQQVQVLGVRLFVRPIPYHRLVLSKCLLYPTGETHLTFNSLMIIFCLLIATGYDKLFRWMRPLMDFEKGYLVLFKRPFIIENSRQSRCGYSAINIGDISRNGYINLSQTYCWAPVNRFLFCVPIFEILGSVVYPQFFFLWVGAKLVRGQDRCLVTHQRRKEKRGLTWFFCFSCRAITEANVSLYSFQGSKLLADHTWIRFFFVCVCIHFQLK